MTSSYQKHKILMAHLSGKHVDDVRALLEVTENSRFITAHIIKPSVMRTLSTLYSVPVYSHVHMMNNNAFIFVYNEENDTCIGIFRKVNFECVAEASCASDTTEYSEEVKRNMRYVKSRLVYASEYSKAAVEILARILCDTATEEAPPLMTITVSVDVPFGKHFDAVKALTDLGLEVKTERKPEF